MLFLKRLTVGLLLYGRTKEVLTPIIDAKLKSDLYTRLSADDSCGHCVSSLIRRCEAAAVYFYTTENDHLSYKVVNPYLRGECHDINLSNHISWIDSALQNYQITQKALCIEVKTHLVVGWT